MKSRDTALLEEKPAGEATPKRVQTAAKVADRRERQELLSAILRDGRATGAEAVAAARLLEAMDRNDAAASDRGIPPPTNRAEQVARMLRLIQAAGPTILCEALDVYVERTERYKAIRTGKPEAKILMEKARAATTRMRKWRKKLDESGGEDQRSEHGPGGAPTAESDGVRELPEPAEFAGEAANQDERNGDRDLQPGAEDGEQQ